ncbi:MAG TPA: MarR family transcriptional regulator [Anaerohalosphaeraceae bacterium]|jgi:DNA-binding MarR family transcriptional regulator|nr:MarR family transcriptional regulator [Anaerohalosphaeraceae bacterium]HRT51278.1 MarR family transcriptional regulator [Anaerohalosphaeraceae bacterium]HRT88135.1 MarR family transcriptional regulator [Anaerohalosphaeraceae bacterium]
MSLNEELGLRHPIATTGHEALLNIYFTSVCIRKRATEFLRRYGLTDVQVNVLMLLKHQADEGEGLSQSQLSSMMLVNRANVTGLVDRLEQAKLVMRTTDPADRRSNVVRLTQRGRRLLEKVEPAYGREVARIMEVLTAAEQRRLIGLLERVRANIANVQ